jgi:hypothetical protein
MRSKRKERPMGAINPEEKIEITPQMVEAGFQVLLASGLGDAILKADKCTVAEVFCAMYRAMQSEQSLMSRRE